MSMDPLIPPAGGERPRGTVTKSKSKYLRTLKSLTMSLSHPRNQGVRMQAHHLISEYGVSLTEHGDRLEDLGYDINEAKNLVFIPSTLQGACMLHVQPHRGNHDHDDDEDDDDGDHDPSYHEQVKKLIDGAMPEIRKACEKKSGNTKKVVQEAMDEISATLALLIQTKPRKARLTKLYANYGLGCTTGCGGVDNVTPHKGIKVYDKCPVNRNHTGRQAVEQRKENIKYVSLGPYTLTPGN